MGLRRLLADPGFVFRFERDPADTAVGAAYRISDLELASRLSFFLWSSIPDEELLARRGKAARCGIRPCSSSRSAGCSTDPRSQSLVTNFAGQWLFLRELRNRNPDLLVFPDFDDNLRQAFQRETEMLFASVVREDRSVFDLMNADYTFVNERLARHYGIPQRVRQRLPARGGAERGAAGTARPGQHPDGDLGAEPHLAGHARRLDSREPARQPSPAAAARRAGVSRSAERPGHLAEAVHGSRPHGAASRQPDVPELSSDHGSDRSGARKLRRRGPLADEPIPGSRSTRRAARRRHVGRQSRRRLRAALPDLSGRVRPDADGEAADVRGRPRGASHRHAVRARDHPGRVARRLSVFVDS